MTEDQTENTQAQHKPDPPPAEPLPPRKTWWELPIFFAALLAIGLVALLGLRDLWEIIEGFLKRVLDLFLQWGDETLRSWDPWVRAHPSLTVVLILAVVVFFALPNQKSPKKDVWHIENASDFRWARHFLHPYRQY